VASLLIISPTVHVNSSILKLTETSCRTALDSYSKFKRKARCWWLTPVILVTQEAEIRRITVPSQPRQIVCETLS
jgi:hypothetical protein